MPIDLKCYATLAPLTPDNASACPLKDGETIRALAERLTIPVEEIKIVKPTEAPIPIADAGDRVFA